MGSGSFLALVARHSLLRRISSRHYRAGAAHGNIPDSQYAHQMYDQEQLVLCEWLDEESLHVQSTAAPPAGGQLLLRFHTDLAERLQHLQLQGSGSAHLNWLLDALASTLSTHSSLRSALSTAPAHLVGQHACQRADEVLSLLDVCSALKQVADDMQRQQHMLQQALQSVGQALAQAAASGDHETRLSSPGRIRAAARRLSACLNDRPHSLLRIASKQYRPLADAHTCLLLAAAKTVELPISAAAAADPALTLLSQAMDGTMLTSLLMLASALSSCVAAPSPRKSPIAGACKAITRYLGGKSRALAPAWAAPLRQLQRDLRQQEIGGALFQELQRLHLAAANIHAAITNPDIHLIDLAVVRHTVDCLRKSSREAQECITTLHMHMASLFQALVSLRLALLES